MGAEKTNTQKPAARETPTDLPQKFMRPSSTPQNQTVFLMDRIFVRPTGPRSLINTLAWARGGGKRV